MRRFALTSLFATFILILSACSGSNHIDKIKVSDGDTPKVTIPSDFSTEKTETRVIKKGDGEKLQSGDTVKFQYIALTASTGEEFDNSFSSGQSITLPLDEDTTLPGFYKGLINQRVGSRVIVTVAPKDGSDLIAGQNIPNVEAGDTVVFLFDIKGTTLKAASGEEKKAPAHLPKVVLSDKGQPTGFKATKTSDKKLTKTQSAVLIKGEGAKVKAGQTVSAQYIGQKHPDGEIFDESWSSGSRQFAVGAGQLIPCWDEELVGHTIGSRVIVACKSSDAYGKDAKANGQPEGDLIFVIDILDAS